MRYCVPCNAEFTGNPARCPDCNSRTLTEVERAAWSDIQDDITNEILVPVFVLRGPVDEALLTSLFDDAGIPWMVRGHHHDPFGAAVTGWGVLLVPEDDAQRALDVAMHYEKLSAEQEVPDEG